MNTNQGRTEDAQSKMVYCYHCRVAHPKEEMRLLVTRTGKRWRCIHSIKAIVKDQAKRDEFGRQITAENQAKARTAQKLRQAG